MNRNQTAGLAVASALALQLGCGAQEPAPAASVPPATMFSQQPIISGEVSKDKQFPTVVGLLLDAYGIDQMNPNPLMPKCVRGKGACTGTLIREDVILTASHCITNLLKQFMDPSCQKDPEPPEYSFEVDLIGAARGMRVTATAKAVAHPMFGPTMCKNPPSVDRWNDIALVFLKNPVKGVPLQKLAKPADAAALLKEGSKVRIVGYGKSKVDDDMSAGTQHFGIATLAKVGDYEIQAGQAGEQQGCQGDSGGPVFANPDGAPENLVQIGVASRLRTLKCPGLLDIFNPPKCENGVIYTRVDPFYDWIEQTIQKERPAAEGDLRKPEEPDMAGPAEADLASPGPVDGETPPDKGCKCSVGGSAAAGGGPTVPMLLLAGAVLGRLLRRRR